MSLTPLLLAAGGGEFDVGRSIYREGQGQDPIVARHREFDVDLEPRNRACARCHGADGGGTREGGVVAPPLTGARGMSPDGALEWLTAALSTGRGLGGRALKSVMPAYGLSERDQRALAAYLRTLPYPPEPGLAADSLRLGVTLDGAGLDAEATAAVGLLMQREIDAINRQGGLFGRQLVLADRDLAGVVVTMAWAADPAATGPRFSVRPPVSDRAQEIACGVLHPPVSEQARWLAQHLNERGRRVRIVEAEARDAPSAGEAEAIIYKGRDIALAAGMANNKTGDIFAFSDLVGGQLSSAAQAPLTLVTPIDIRAQMRRVEQLQRDEAAMGLSPRTASIALEMLRALAIVATALKQQGRRLTGVELCQRISVLARESWRFSLLPAGASPTLDQP
ncbi:MAG: cytochrome c [Candidatus Competibacteraceae bacterium]|nr:cytochrome c [Candidatus Competibacteraceae bacterium]